MTDSKIEFRLGDQLVVTERCDSCKGDMVGSVGKVIRVRNKAGRYEIRIRRPSIGTVVWMVCERCARLALVDEIEINQEFIYDKA